MVLLLVFSLSVAHNVVSLVIPPISFAKFHSRLRKDDAGQVRTQTEATRVLIPKANTASTKDSLRAEQRIYDRTNKRE